VRGQYPSRSFDASDRLRGMKRSALDHHPCSIARTLDVAGEWWTLLILKDIAYGVRRFRELQDDLGISANVLADRLEALVAEGILDTHVYQERPQRSEYRLTEKGTDLIPALLALMQWGDRWKWPGSSGPVRVLHEQCEHEVHVQVRCEHCDRETGHAELRAKPRRGVVQPPAEGEPGSVSGARLLSLRDGVGLGADS
jgi:DNA-binding HxlR family transcriptional regulator